VNFIAREKREMKSKKHDAGFWAGGGKRKEKTRVVSGKSTLHRLSSLKKADPLGETKPGCNFKTKRRKETLVDGFRSKDLS